MFKKVILVFSFTLLFGCSAHIRENSFIAQDKEIINFSSADLNSWKVLFPEHKLKPIQILTKNDSTLLRGLFLAHGSSEDVIFFIPGNGMKVSEGGIDAIQTLAKLEKSIVIFDRRGSGASEGEATISSLISDSIDQYQFIKNELHASLVIVHGYSLGSFVAGQLAKNEPIDALVLQGSATNVDDWIDKSIPWYTKPFLTVEVDEAFNAIDNRVVVADYYKGPLFVIGAENDEQVPVELSELLFNASNSSNKELLIVEDANHGNMLDNNKELLIYKKFLTSINSL